MPTPSRIVSLGTVIILALAFASAGYGADSSTSPDESAFIQKNLTPEEQRQFSQAVMGAAMEGRPAMEAKTQELNAVYRVKLAARGVVYAPPAAPVAPGAPTAPAAQAGETGADPAANSAVAVLKKNSLGGYDFAIADMSINFVNLGPSKSSTWSVVATADGFRVIAIPAYSKESFGKGTRNLEVVAGAVKLSGEIGQPVIPSAQASGQVIRAVLPNGMFAGRTPVAGSPIDRAFGPTPDGTAYTLLPWPKPIQCNGEFDTVGFCEVTRASADGAIYGKYALRMGGKEFGMAPVRWSIVNGAWVCQALIDNVAMAGLQIEYAGSNSELVFFNVSQADGSLFGSGPCVSRGAASLTAVEGDRQYVLTPGQERSQYGGPSLKGRIVDASSTMTVALYGQAGSTDQDFPVLFTDKLWQPKPKETIKGATNAAILGSTVFVTTKAATFLIHGDAVTNLSSQKIEIESIEAKTAGGFVAKGTVAGTSGYWLVSAQATKP